MSDRKEPNVAAIAASLSEWVRGTLADGAAPSEVAYALAAVATDMGLEVAKDPYRVLPVILSAVRDQLASRVAAANDNEAATEPDWRDLADRSTIH